MPWVGLTVSLAHGIEQHGRAQGELKCICAPRQIGPSASQKRTLTYYHELEQATGLNITKI
jgi:hypothetical protein